SRGDARAGRVRRSRAIVRGAARRDNRSDTLAPAPSRPTSVSAAASASGAAPVTRAPSAAGIASADDDNRTGSADRTGATTRADYTPGEPADERHDRPRPAARISALRSRGGGGASRISRRGQRRRQ